MAPKQQHSSSRSSRKAEKWPKKRETTNDIRPTDAEDTLLERDFKDGHGLVHNYSSTTFQVPSNQQGGYQSIDRTWRQHTTNKSSPVVASDASPMERWRNADAYDQPWHGIGAVYVDAQNNGEDQREYGGVEAKSDDIDEIAVDGSSKERGI